MFAIEINNNKYAVGLKWSRLPGEKVKAELTALSKEMDLTFGITRKLEENEGQFIYQAGLAGDKTVSGLVPAAAIVADLVENIILVQKLSDNQFWICCVMDSEVVPGGDELVTRESLESKFYDLRSYFESSDVRLCVDETVHELFSDALEDNQFEDILEEYSVEKPLKEFAHYKISSLKGAPLPAIMFGALVLFAGGAGYFVTQLNSGPVIVDMPDPVVPEVIIKKEPVVAPKPAEPTREELLAKARIEEISWLKKEMEESDPYQIISALGEFTYMLPKNYAGWRASKVIYDKKLPHKATVEWTKSSIGTTLTLKEEMKSHSGLSFSLNGFSAQSRHDIKGTELRDVGEDVLAHIKNDKYKNAELMHDLEAMGLVWKLEMLEDDKPRRKPIAGIKNNTDARKKQLEMVGKYFVIKGSTFESIYIFNEIFSKSKSAILDTVVINLEENNWTVNGVLYEK